MSFLEKLQKGMADEQAPQIPAEPENGLEESGDPEQAAVFAAYKKKGILPFDEAAPTKKTKSRGRPKKIITAISQLEEDGGQEPAATGETERPSKKTLPNPPKKIMAKKIAQRAEDKKETEWLDGEGQLTVDVYQTETDLVVQSAIAGVKVEDLDVLIEDDMITIKGSRPNPLQENGDYFIQECYWGPFSRKIILPAETDSSRADAAMKDGILTIRIPKIQREKKKKVSVKE